MPNRRDQMAAEDDRRSKTAVIFHAMVRNKARDY